MADDRPASRDHHPSKTRRGRAAPAKAPAPAEAATLVPEGVGAAVLQLGARAVKLTNLDKPFWPAVPASATSPGTPALTKGDLLRYYASVAPWLLPHLAGRAMVMRRYPNGATGESFFMKRAPSHRPDWLTLCSIAHGSGNVIDFPVVDDLASLLWVVNLGCIDLNPWYATCDDVDRPDVLHFDLDPTPGARFDQLRDAALAVREQLEGNGLPCRVKTTGSRGLHVYVPIARGPTQKEVWRFAKAFAVAVAARHPKLLTSEYRVAARPARRVLVDYNQNAWGRTLASVYSVRPTPLAMVSTPLDWAELEAGARLEDFRVTNVLERLRERGDLWAPMAATTGRADLTPYLAEGRVP